MAEPGTAEWHQQRRQGIGASEVAVACGFGRYRTRYDLWREKTGATAPWGGNEATLWGQRNEPHILKDWADRNEARIIETQRQFRVQRWPLLWATVDAIAHTIDGEDVIVEAKCTTSRNAQLGDGGDDAPPEWLAQVQVQMLLSGLERAYIAVLIDGNKSREYCVQFDRAVAEALADRAEAWYCEAVETPVPPIEWGNTDQQMQRLVEFGGRDLVDMQGSNLPTIWAHYEDLGRKIKELEEERAELKSAAIVAMGDNSRCLIAPDRELVIQEKTRAGYMVKPAKFVQISAKKVK
jgi:putative phage-type endonuclease